MKMKTLKPGDVIKPKKEVKKDLKSTFNRTRNIKEVLSQIMDSIAQEERELWRLVKELYPETKDFHLAFDSKTGNILVKNKLHN
jgi:RNA binding exosome subunit